MAELHILQDLAIMLAFSVASLFICHRLNLPSIVGFLVTGLLIGPYGFGLIRSVHEVEVLAEIGVVLLLFAIGLEFSIKDLLRSKRAVLLGGTLQVGLTIGATMLAAWRFDLPLNQAVFAGFLVALSSTAIVLRTLQDRAELDSVHGRTILSILIFQDIIIAPMVIVTPLLAGGSGDLAGSFLSLIGKGVAVVVAVVLLARYAVPYILYQITRTRSRELFLLSTALLCVTVAWSTNELGLSLGLGAFLAGLIISESEYSYEALEGILPFKTVFTSFFFVSVGMLLDLSLFVSEPLVIVGAAVGVLAIKTILASGVALLLGMSSRAAIVVGLALSQVGEFSFILSRVGVSEGLLSEHMYGLFLAVAVVTMALTPFIIAASHRIAEVLSRWPLLRTFTGGSYTWMSEQAAGGTRTLTDHVVIVGFGINGRNIALAARSAGIPYVIIEMNPDTVRTMQAEGEPIIYGDATSREVVHHAAVTKARVVVIAISDPVGTRHITHTIRTLNPGAYLIVRTRFVKEVPSLKDLGADEVVPEEFETSVEIFTRVLMKYLIPRDQIEHFTSEIRSGNYEMFRSMSQQAAQITDLQLQTPDFEINAIRLSEDCAVVNQTLAEADFRRRFGVTVVAIQRDRHLTANPAGSERLLSEDTLYVLGSTEHCAEASRALAAGTS